MKENQGEGLRENLEENIGVNLEEILKENIKGRYTKENN